MRVKVEAPNLQRLITVLGSGQVVSKELRRAFTLSSLRVRDRAQRYAPVDQGHLRRSIANRVDPSLYPSYAEVGTNLEYAKAVHEGRPPGKMPPVKALEAWAKKRGLNAWAVAKSIEKKGTKPNPFLANALQDSAKEITGEFEDALERMVSQWGN